MSRGERNLETTERVVAMLSAQGVRALVIGAVAMAAHRYIRFTEDIDLGIDTDVATMRKLTHQLQSAGYRAEFHEPDADDPLGGVIDISGDFGLIQIVNFGNRFPIVIEDAWAGQDIRIRENSMLRVIPIAQLVAMKLYAGGRQSKSDIVELLRRNPKVDLEDIRETCRKYRLRGLDEVLEELE